MSVDAEALLVGTGWLPGVLHVPGVTYPADAGGTAGVGEDTKPMPIAAE